MHEGHEPEFGSAPLHRNKQVKDMPTAARGTRSVATSSGELVEHARSTMPAARLLEVPAGEADDSAYIRTFLEAPFVEAMVPRSIDHASTLVNMSVCMRAHMSLHRWGTIDCGDCCVARHRAGYLRTRARWHVYRTCVQTSVLACASTCAGMSADMRICMRIGMRIGMGMGMCIGVRIGMCIAVCIDMRRYV